MTVDMIITLKRDTLALSLPGGTAKAGTIFRLPEGTQVEYIFSMPGGSTRVSYKGQEFLVMIMDSCPGN